MNIYEYYNIFPDLKNHKRADFANRLLNELTKRINQEYKDYGSSPLFEEDLLPILLNAEAEDYFGTEGYQG